MQDTQQVFVAEEWVWDARNEVKAKAHSRVETEKSLGALKQEQVKLANKLIATDRAHLRAKASLKNVGMQAEDQHKQFQTTEIELATQRQLVPDLKAELQKAKDTARMASETTSYKRGVLETETRLVEEVAGMCRDYCAETWAKALNRARVPADSELRRAENIFFQEDIREVPTMLPPPVTDPLPPPEQLPTIQAPSSDAEVSTGAGKDKKVQPSVKANQFEDTLMIQDVVSKAKDVESKSKAADPKEDPHQTKA